MKFLDLDASEKNKLIEQTFTQDNMEEFIINFFTGKLKYQFKKEQKSQFELKIKSKKKLFLLCLDNATQLIEDD